MRRFSMYSWLMMSAVGLGWAGSASAVEPVSPTARRAAAILSTPAEPLDIQLVNCTEGSACDAASSCDGVAGDCVGGCETGCGGCGCFGGELGDPWTAISLFDDECGANHFKDNGWVMGGYTQFGYQNSPDGAFTGNGPFLNQKEWNRFALNQQYMYLGKVADGSNGVGFGFRADFMYGIDGNEGQSFGNVNPGHWDYLNGWGGPGDPNSRGPYEFAMPQLYGEVASGDLSVKVGHFYTPTGYEVIPSNQNFFLSHQLTWYNSEAFTHTGFLANYKVNDKLSVQGGWTLGWDTGFYQYHGGSNFTGGFIYNYDDKTAFVESTTIGNLGWRGDGILNTMVLSRRWSDKISTVHQFDVFNTNLTVGGTPANFNNPTTVPGGGITQDSISILNYAFYDLSPKVKLGVRQEWYLADHVSYQTYTYGVNFKPTSNLVIRPEVRHMISDNHNIYSGQGYSGQLFNQTVLGVDAILTF